MDHSRIILSWTYVRSLGLRVQRDRIRASLTRVDPVNSQLRWASIITRRTYSVPWPNSLWHMDGNHALIRWGFVIHDCIDGFSRMIMFMTFMTFQVRFQSTSLKY